MVAEIYRLKLMTANWEMSEMVAAFKHHDGYLLGCWLRTQVSVHQHPNTDSVHPLPPAPNSPWDSTSPDVAPCSSSHVASCALQPSK